MLADDLVKALQARLTLFGQSQDPSVLFSETAVAEMDAAFELSEGADDVQLVLRATLGRLLQEQARLVDGAAAQRLNTMAGGLFSDVALFRPMLVPPSVWEQLSTDPEAQRHRAELAEQTLAAVWRSAGDGPAGQKLVHCCFVLLHNGMRTNRLLPVDAAALAGQRAVATVPPGSRTWSLARLNLSAALLQRFAMTGVPGDLAEAERLCREGLTGTHEQAALNGSLAHALVVKHTVTGAAQPLREALAACRQALPGLRDDDPDRVGVLAATGTAMALTFNLTGEHSDLDGAIEATLAGARLGRSLGDPQAVVLGAAAGNMFLTRFHHRGELLDLDRSVAEYEVALDGLAKLAAPKANFLSNLCGVLLTRYEQRGADADLAEAVRTGRLAVGESVAGHMYRSTHLANLALALMRRYELTQDQATLEEALSYASQSVQASEGGHASQAEHLSRLASAMRLAERTDRDFLDAAVAIAAQAVTLTSPSYPDAAGFLHNYAQALRQRHDGLGDPADYHGAARASRTAAGLSTSPARARLLAARSWGDFAAASGDLREAGEAYEHAVRLLPLIAWHGLTREARQHHLEVANGVAPAAAACRVAVGDPAQAVKLLELGRSVMWSQELQIRDTFSGLGSAHPARAAELQRLRLAMETVRVSSPTLKMATI